MFPSNVRILNFFPHKFDLFSKDNVTNTFIILDNFPNLSLLTKGQCTFDWYGMKVTKTAKSMFVLIFMRNINHKELPSLLSSTLFP